MVVVVLPWFCPGTRKCTLDRSWRVVEDLHSVLWVCEILPYLPTTTRPRPGLAGMDGQPMA